MAKAWSVDPNAFSSRVEEDVGKRLRIISLALLSEIVLRSPVKSGMFRANNIVTLGTPEYDDIYDFDLNGARTIQQGNAVIAQGKPFSVIYIQNNLPYAERLEHGHSKQAPTGVYANAFNGVSQAYK